MGLETTVTNALPQDTQQCLKVSEPFSPGLQEGDPFALNSHFCSHFILGLIGPLPSLCYPGSAAPGSHQAPIPRQGSRLPPLYGLSCPLHGGPVSECTNKGLSSMGIQPQLP